MAEQLTEATQRTIISRIPDFETLDIRTQAEEAIKVIAADFYIYCERNLMIKDKRGQMVPLVLNWAQKILVERVLDDIEHDRPVRYIILKARQMGLSTVIEALCFWWTTTHTNVNSVIIAHKKKAAKNLYKMFRRYYEYAHEHFQPDRKYNTKDDLSFDVTDEVKADFRSRGLKPPGLGSEIQTLVAAEGEGRSDTILFFHGSEVAHWDAGNDVLSSALQAIPMLPGTFAFLESTANGVGGYFYDEWQFAVKGESAFKPVFFAWHEHPEYMIRDDQQLVYDEEELELLEIFKRQQYAPETWNWKLIWRREKKKEFRSEPDKFYQEYPKDDTEAFLASGRPVFDIKKLIEMEKKARSAPPPLFANIITDTRPGMQGKWDLEFVPQLMDGFEPTPFKIWDVPADKVEKFTIGVDVAEGIERGTDEKHEGDYSVVDVMRQSDLKTVARWRGHIDPDLLGDLVVQIATIYNYALVAVEINNHGLTTAQRMRDLFYRNMYQRETSEEEQFQTRTSKMGWKTDRKTKPIVINELAKTIRENDIIDLDIVFIRECMTYVRDDQGKTAAQENMFDDCVMAKAINLQMANWNSYDLASVNIVKPVKRHQGNNETHRSNRTVVAARRAARRSHAAGYRR